MPHRLEVPPADALFLVGQVGKPHGVMGEMKVIPETDNPQHFDELPAVYVGAGPEQVSAYAVTQVRHQQTKLGLTVLLVLESVSNREEAAALRGLYVYASLQDLPALGEDEYYLHDLVGLRVSTEEGDAIGTVQDILELPGNDVLVVARPHKKAALIPAVPAFIVDINFDAGCLTIRPIEGLLD